MRKFPDICDVFPQVPETFDKRAGQTIQVYIFSLDMTVPKTLQFCCLNEMYPRGASTKRAEIDKEGAGRRYARAKSIDSMIFWKFDLGPYVSFPISFGGLPKIWYVHKIAIWRTSDIW